MPDVMPEASAKASWPAWFYGPGGQAEIFQNEDEVPEGWHDSPAKVGDATVKKEAVTNADAASPYEGWDDAAVIAELKERKLEFGEKWGRPRLEKALLDDDKKKGK